MTRTSTSDAGRNHEFRDQQRNRAIQTVCMALALASAVLLIRAVSLL